jgi:hypothetical protein
MGSFYVYLSSDDSDEYYNNTPSDFCIYLPQNIMKKTKQWYVGLAEMQYSFLSSDGENVIDIYSDICYGSIIHEKRRPILRQITILDYKSKQPIILKKVFNPIFYIPVNQIDIRQIRIYINKMDGSSASFLLGTTRCTLHFKCSSK